MTLQELKNRVRQEFDRRKLKSNARYNAGSPVKPCV